MRNTGPDVDIRMRVLWRDAYECVRCGETLHERRAHHIHHRRPRGMGGTCRDDANAMTNLLSLCVDCHTHIESRRAEGYESGWLVSQCSDPAQVACLVGRGSRWVYLTADGAYSDAPAEAVSA